MAEKEERKCECGEVLEWNKASDICFGDFYSDVQAWVCPKCGVVEVNQY